jgi:transcriptional regulator with XRE-family HTH domain
MKFGKYLKRLRLNRGLTLLEVRRLTGVSVGYLSDIEQGNRPPPHPAILNSLARIYGVTPEELLRAAGYLVKRVKVVSREAAIEWAFDAILRDPTFGPFIDKGRAEYMPSKTKLKFIRMYERMTGRKLL